VRLHLHALFALTFAFFSLFLSKQFSTDTETKYLSQKGPENSAVRGYTGSSGHQETEFGHELSHKLPKKARQSKVNRADETEGDSGFELYGGHESKPGPSLLHQLMPGQAFDPRTIDFSALTLPNSHKSTKNKKR